MKSSSYSFDASLLPSLIDYDANTGVFVWKARKPEQFPKPGRTTLERICAVWNVRWAGKEAFTCTSRSGYRYCSIFDRQYRAHHVAWAIIHGTWPKSDIDHIDGDPTNNRIDNLRLADATTNARNRGLSAQNASGVMGVHWNEEASLWVAAISDGNRKITLGRFHTIAEAAACRVGAERVLNFHENHGKRASRAVRQSGVINDFHQGASK